MLAPPGTKGAALAFVSLAVTAPPASKSEIFYSPPCCLEDWNHILTLRGATSSPFATTIILCILHACTWVCFCVDAPSSAHDPLQLFKLTGVHYLLAHSRVKQG